MATFPALKPSTRTYTPGEYPNSAFKAISGIEGRVRHSNVMLDASLRLTFNGITEVQMLSILTHYNTQRGGFRSFELPSDVWVGLSSLTSFTPSGYTWRYAGSPAVTDIFNGYHTVEVTLVTVPPEGAAITGIELTVSASMSAGAGTGTANATGSTLALSSGLTSGFAVADAITAAGLNLGTSSTVSTEGAQGSANATGASISAVTSFTAGAATATPPPGPTDPNFSSVVLLLHFNGANNSTTITDSSSKNLTATAYNSAVISTGASKFGGSSLYMTRNYLDGVDVAATTELNFGTGDFTFEYWYLFVSRENFNYCRVFGHTTTAETSGTFRIRMAADTSGGNVLGEHILCAANSGSARVVGTRQSVIDGAWHHIAFCRSGSTIYCFRDGVLKESATNTTDYSYGSTGGLRIGSRSVGVNDFSNVYIDDVRVTKGVARYTATFTAPTAQFPDA